MFNPIQYLLFWSIHTEFSHQRLDMLLEVSGLACQAARILNLSSDLLKNKVADYRIKTLSL